MKLRCSGDFDRNSGDRMEAREIETEQQANRNVFESESNLGDVDSHRLLQIQGNIDIDSDEGWLDTDERFPPVPLVYDPLLAKEDLRRANQAPNSVTRLRLAANTSNQLPDPIHHQLKIVESKIYSLRLRAGALKLPDEVLSVILEYAAHNERFTWQCFESMFIAMEISRAITLTHVCRRFRSLATRIPTLWSRISNASHLGAISACCERVTNSSVEIFLHGGRWRPATNVAPFLQATIAHSDKWNVFRLGDDPQPMTELLDDEEIEDLARETHNLQVNFLTEISINYPYTITSSTNVRPQVPKDSFHYYSTWSTPRLKSFSIRHLVPIPFSGSASLTTFKARARPERGIRLTPICPSYTVQGENYQLIVLVEFLSTCPNLEFSSLEILSLPTVDSSPMPKYHEFGSIERMKFHFANCEVSSLKSFFDCISFPNVSSLDLTLQMPYDANISIIEDGFRAIIPGAGRFPRLVTLVSSFDSYARHLNLPPYVEDRDINIPFSVFSHVQNLTLTLHDFGISESVLLDGLRWRGQGDAMGLR
ncbi:hypothetical protein SCHPADRAFT_475302 [Schizopora paradoxa]|uniref:Uncharacterized protein n=1 Tax=Schizopora paradoxa TaxID=27342 RepID=A0A0H2RI97_9AGAM|nr:hypothetical protein SCHPADRAFT_475302 [Schizopora paradoxa]